MATMDDHPGTKLLKDNRLGPKHKKKMQEEEKLNLCIDWVTELSKQECCYDRHHKRKLSCNCLGTLCNHPNAIKAVSRYMVHYFVKGWKDRKVTLIDWLKYSARDPKKLSGYNFSNTRQFLLIPFIDLQVQDPVNNEVGLVTNQNDVDWQALLKNQPVCKNAIGLLLKVGYDVWKDCESHVLKNTYPVHGNTGKITGQEVFYKANVEPALKEYFEEIRKLACPRASKAIREVCGGGLRNSHDESETPIEDLPSHWSMRAVYVRFVQERGWKTKCLPDGKVALSANDSLEQLPVCVLSTFYQYWKKNYPHLRVQKPSEDICGQCHTFYHSFRRHKEAEEASESEAAGCCIPTVIPKGTIVYKKVKQSKVAGKVVATPSDANDDDSTTIYYTVKWGHDDSESQYTRIEIINKLLPSKHPLVEEQRELEAKAKGGEKEDVLAKADLHVRQADAQRMLVNRKMEECCADENDSVPHEKRRYCLIADFSQSEQLPFFGQEQPGETYYYSPRKVNIFGIVNCCWKGGKLTSYVYLEGEGKRGETASLP